MTNTDRQATLTPELQVKPVSVDNHQSYLELTYFPGTTRRPHPSFQTRSKVGSHLHVGDEPFGDGVVEDIPSPPSNKLPYVLPSALRRPIAALLALLAITLGGATACGREGSQTNCSLVGCTVTFQRTGTAEISVLGVKAKLVGVEGNNARLEVAGQTVTVPVGGEAAAGSFTVRVEQVTDTAVVVRIAP